MGTWRSAAVCNSWRSSVHADRDGTGLPDGGGVWGWGLANHPQAQAPRLNRCSTSSAGDEVLTMNAAQPATPRQPSAYRTPTVLLKRSVMCVVVRLGLLSGWLLVAAGGS